MIHKFQPQVGGQPDWASRSIWRFFDLTFQSHAETTSPTGWWLTYPSEKYESQLEWLFPIYGKTKNVPHHQPALRSFPVLFDHSKHSNESDPINGHFRYRSTEATVPYKAQAPPVDGWFINPYERQLCRIFPINPPVHQGSKRSVNLGIINQL